MKKIYNYQEVSCGVRSNILEIFNEDIQALKDWKENPYTGNTDKELVEYISELNNYLQDEMSDWGNEKQTNTPEFAKTLYNQLFGDCVERTEVWSSLSKSGESQLVLEDNDGNELATAGSGM